MDAPTTADTAAPGGPGEGSAAHVLVRVWLPDRPGALGLVASRIGAVGGDIVGIDVLERGADVAVDEFAVVLGTLDVVELLVREVEEVDGASVEEVRVVGAFPDPRLDALGVRDGAVPGRFGPGAAPGDGGSDPPGVRRRLGRAARG